MSKTYMAKNDTVERKWYLVDASGKTLGRLASAVATILKGKTNQLIHHMLIVVIT